MSSYSPEDWILLAMSRMVCAPHHQYSVHRPQHRSSSSDHRAALDIPAASRRVFDCGSGRMPDGYWGGKAVRSADSCLP
jgi:hypothetical protein